MSKELKPYEKENEIIRKLRECRNSKQYALTQLNATEKGLERNIKTHKHDVEIYAKDLESQKNTLETLDRKISEYTNHLKEFLPRPKPKKVVKEPILDGKLECDICHKFYKKSGLKSHRKAC